jgi:hypothetical protein
MTADDDLLAHADGAILESRRIASELRVSMRRVEQAWARLRDGHAWARRGCPPPRIVRDDPAC